MTSNLMKEGETMANANAESTLSAIPRAASWLSQAALGGNTAVLHGKPRFDLSLLRRLIRLKNEHPLFVYGDFKPLATGVADVYAFERSAGGGPGSRAAQPILEPHPESRRGANLERGPPPDAMKAADP